MEDSHRVLQKDQYFCVGSWHARVWTLDCNQAAYLARDVHACCNRVRDCTSPSLGLLRVQTAWFELAVTAVAAVLVLFFDLGESPFVPTTLSSLGNFLSDLGDSPNLEQPPENH